MIVRNRPGAFRLMLAWKGSVLPHILPQVISIGVFSALVTWISRHHYLDGIVEYTLLPFTIMGIALSILLSVRNTATYDRWWEARRQWGKMVYEIRSLARASTIYLDAGRRRELLMRCLDLSPKSRTASWMRFPDNRQIRGSQHEEALQRRTDH